MLLSDSACQARSSIPRSPLVHRGREVLGPVVAIGAIGIVLVPDTDLGVGAVEDDVGTALHPDTHHLLRRGKPSGDVLTVIAPGVPRSGEPSAWIGSIRANGVQEVVAGHILAVDAGRLGQPRVDRHWRASDLLALAVNQVDHLLLQVGLRRRPDAVGALADDIARGRIVADPEHVILPIRSGSHCLATAHLRGAAPDQLRVVATLAFTQGAGIGVVVVVLLLAGPTRDRRPWRLVGEARGASGPEEIFATPKRLELLPRVMRVVGVVWIGTAPEGVVWIGIAAEETVRPCLSVGGEVTVPSEVGDADRAAEARRLGLGDTLTDSVVGGQRFGDISIAEVQERAGGSRLDRRKAGAEQRDQERSSQEKRAHGEPPSW